MKKKTITQVLIENSTFQKSYRKKSNSPKKQDKKENERPNSPKK